MFAQERFQAISGLLAKKQKVSVQELQRFLKISSATLRRDLAELESGNKVIRVHGGVMHPNFFHGEPSYAQKALSSTHAKREMALRASELIPKSSTVFIDAGTSCFELGRLLITRPDLTLITNSLSLLRLDISFACKLISLGGEIRNVSKALVGTETLSSLKLFRADFAFVGASGLSSSEGASTTELNEAGIKKLFCEHSSKAVLLADGSKWNKPSLVSFAPWNSFSHWITSDEVPAAATQKIQAHGPKVIRCKTN